MTAIITAEYRTNYAELADEEFIHNMALDTIVGGLPFALVTDSGRLTWQFVQAAHHGYKAALDAKLATTPALSIGAPAEAIMIARKRILDQLATN